jgi:tRNA(Ile)-lysidine synthase
VALLDLLRRLAESWNLHLHVAHLHHGIRGTDADADAAFVGALAEHWELPCTVEHADLPEIAGEERLALEEACRRVRYAFLTRVAEQVGARAIA